MSLARATGTSAAELLKADFPEPRRICGDFVQEGVTILAGPPKTGKTTLMRQMAEAVGGGGELFTEKCERGAVVFVSLEEGPRLFRRKLKAMEIDANVAGAIDLHFDWPRGAAGCARLAQYVTARPELRLVVVDSLARFREEAAKNATQFQADYDAVAGLGSVAKQCPGLAIVVIHHTRKMRSADAMDDISGTYGLTAAADAYLVLRKEGRGATLHAGGRLWDREESQYTLEREGQRYRLVGVSDGLTDRERDVLRIVAGSGGLGPNDLAKILGITRQGCYAFLDALLTKGKVSKKDGFYVAL